MNISRFFIDRPIFAAVLSVFITIVGIAAYPLLPLSQYPEIAPPTITVNAAFPGASAETLAETVAAPLEQEINGVEGMLYVSSSSTSDGAVAITVTFKPGTDLDSAQVLVQNRVALAEPRLPDQVRQTGIVVAKASQGFLLIASVTSPDKSLSNDYLGNYANSTMRDRLLRIEGVGGVTVFGGGNYSMRVWIDPAKAAARDLSANEIVAALRAQNVQAAAGSIGQPPFATNASAFQQPIQVQGRLTTPEEFGKVVLKTNANGAVTRLSDIAASNWAPRITGSAASSTASAAWASPSSSSRAPTRWAPPNASRPNSTCFAPTCRKAPTSRSPTTPPSSSPPPWSRCSTPWSRPSSWS